MEEVSCKSKDCFQVRVICKRLFAVNDFKGEIAKARPKGDESIWPHDSALFVVYICPECGDLQIVWNQG